MPQVSMALTGADVPNGKSAEHQLRREEIFDIVAPYCFSAEDMAALAEYPDSVKDLWLMSFTNSQNVMISSKLMTAVKDHFRSYFPDKGASPKASLGKKIGLVPGQSILDR